MKIALFWSDPHPKKGGGSNYQTQILKGILKLSPKSRHTFVFFTTNNEIPDYLLASGIEIVRLHRSTAEKIESKITRVAHAGLRKLREPLKPFAIDGWYNDHVLSLIERNRVDLILSLSPYFQPVDYPYIMPLWDLVHRLHPYFPEVSSNGAWEGRDRMYFNSLGRASVIVAGTEVGKADIVRSYHIVPDRIKVIPFATPELKLNPTIDTASVAKKYNLPEDYLFYPAHFWPHKNHVGLLLAMSHLKERFRIEVPLVCVGADKGNQAYVQQTAHDLGLSAQVHFLGFCPEEDLARLYQRAFSLTYMSFSGPDNLPPLEAMALGCPVIAANVLGAAEQLGDAALLVDQKKPEEIARAIMQLKSDPGLRQGLVERGKVRASRWTTEDYVREVFSIIDDFEAVRRCWRGPDQSFV
ncbi:MAG TPA: glycosyltransferase family 1 protein [Polyangia bacterium]|jgi:glycosyltransferase involved in cell wall biosynthesis